MNRTSIISNHIEIRDPWSDEILALWVPIAAYWIYSTIWHFIMKAEIPYFEQYRIHTLGDMEKRNKVSFGRVLSMVSLQQVIQVILGYLVLQPVDPATYALEQENSLNWWTALFLSVLHNKLTLSIYLSKFVYWFLIPAIQFLGAM